MRNFVEFSLANNGQLFSRINPRIDKRAKKQKDVNFNRTKKPVHPAATLVVEVLGPMKFS